VVIVTNILKFSFSKFLFCCYLIFVAILNVVGLHLGKNLYNNEHVAIKLVSSFSSLLMNL